MVENEQQPLVSVAVITYNSSKTILETLDSIYNQTYPNIELIISDDCSLDDTIDICKKWLSNHEQRFSSTRIIIPEANTGVTGNCQRVWKSCKTEWLKFIAADDLLHPNCIRANMEFVHQHKEAECIFSKMDVIGISKDEAEAFLQSRYDYSFFQKAQKDQYEQLLKWCSIPAPTSFFNVGKLLRRGLNFDIRIPMLEDRPFFLNLVAAGVPFDFFNEITVSYRVHPDSLCNALVHSPRFYESGQLAYFYYKFPYYYRIDADETIQNTVERVMHIYNEYYQLKLVTTKKSYKIYSYIMHPGNFIKRIKKLLKK